MTRSGLELYEGWLLERVLVWCWTTARCAREIGADPTEVERDFDEALERISRKA